MISRIRLDASGCSAAVVEESLTNAAASLNHNFFASPVRRGEQVIERDMNEPEGSRFAFGGRLLLYPNIAEPVRGIGPEDDFDLRT